MMLSSVLPVIVMAIGLSLPEQGIGQGNDATPCEHMRVMARLARISASPDVPVIQKQAELTCASNVAVDRWPNNLRIKSQAGRWQYPSGMTAKSSNGHWYYADGTTTAREIQGDWYYPDGKTMAKSRRGGWQRPDRRAATVPELMKWACDRIDPERCKELTADYNRTARDEQIVVLIELAWAAEQAGRQR